MRLGTRLIERYVLAAVLPYMGLAWLLLTVVLLAQQATRFAEILGSTRTPLDLTADVLLGLLPNITLFTLPMAVLVGTATGFGRLGSDSELVAMKAAGVGQVRIVAPVLLLGLLASALTLYNGLQLAPGAARLLRHTALRAALFKLESPVEPNTFNTELPGKIIYVREGDLTRGEWGRVFIYWQEPGAPTRIVTARTGRIDASGGQSELVLSDAEVATLPAEGVVQGRTDAGQIITERSEQLRVRLNTGRDLLVEKLESAPKELDEMNWRELSARTRDRATTVRRAAVPALHKRLALCCAPLALALLGAGLGVRVRRGGRGLAVLLSLASMLVYYLALLGGDQLVRAGQLPLQAGAWLATALAVLIGSGLLLTGDRRLGLHWRGLRGARSSPAQGRAIAKPRRRGHYALLGLLDRNIMRALAGHFSVALTTLVGIFLIFTLFELLRYMTNTGARFWLLLRYLFFLIPLAGTSIAPMGMLVAVLVTYALLARRSEAVAWWAAGQSVYRLALPGLLFALVIGAGLWLTQEHVLPAANRRQEALRAQIKGGAAQAVTAVGRQWLAIPESQRIYTYLYDEATDTLAILTIFEFDEAGVHVRRVLAAGRGALAGGGGRFAPGSCATLRFDAAGSRAPARGGHAHAGGGYAGTTV